MVYTNQDRILKAIAHITNSIHYLEFKPFRAFHRDSSIQQLKEARTLLTNIKGDISKSEEEIKNKLIQKLTR